ncbi:MAG: carboxypeptidase regulatory-like domain-containing protein [Gemmatimonadales bacterium]
MWIATISGRCIAGFIRARERYVTARVLVVAGAVGAGLGSAAVVRAQQPGRPAGAVRGEVVSAATGERLAYVVVALQPAFPQRFTDDSGYFLFAGVPAGAYRLVVRQVGYLPVDTVVVVRDGPVPVRIAMRSVAFELPAIIVVRRPTCRSPGPPDPALSPELAVAFEQLRQNADRYRLLAEAYPFRYWIVRTIAEEDRDGVRQSERVDTAALQSWGRWRYGPGRVVTLTDEPGRASGERVMHIPELPDLADSVFHGTHCFSFGGLEAFEGRSLLRIEFLAARALRSSDVDGTAWLDPRTYQLQQLRLQLTRPSRAGRGVRALVAEVWFREIAPFVVVPGRVAAVTRLGPARPRLSVVRRTEEQVLLRLEFLRPLPTRQP